MHRIVSTFGLAAALCAGALSMAPVTATAQDLQIEIGRDGIRPVIRDRDRDRVDDRGRCSERAARAAARDSGLRDAEVVRVNNRRVVVEGMTRRGPERITFANRRGCPEI